MMNANDHSKLRKEVKTLLENLANDDFHRSNNPNGPKCTGCGQEYENIIDDTMRCLVKKSNAKVVRIDHLCETPGKVHICLGCNRYNTRLDRLETCCTFTKQTTAQSVAAALPEKDDNDSCQQLDACGGLDDCASDTFQDTNERVSITDPSVMEEWIQANFNNETAFNNKSSNFWKNEHNKQGNGKACLVSKALLNTNDPEKINIDDINSALLRTSLHFKSTSDTSKDIIEVTNHSIKEVVRENEASEELLYECMRESISDSISEVIKAHIKALGGVSGLSEKMESLDISGLSEKVVKSTKQKVKEAKTHQSQSAIDLPNSKEIRNQYLDGKNSILQNLPIPNVQMAHGFAFVPLEQTVNLFLAMGLPLRYYENDADWKDDNGKYEGKYFESLHNKLKSDERFVEGNRSYIARGWSDGFNLHYVKVDKNYNNLQVFTITLLGKNGQPNHSWPVAIGFKQSDHSNVLNMFLAQAKQLENPKYRYVGGSEKKLLPVSIHFQVLMNDYIERAGNTGTTQNGTFTHRWGYSCFYCENTTPSCELCRRKRVDRILSSSSDDDTTQPQRCDDCTDWWRTKELNNLEKYPIRIDKLDSIKRLEKAGQLKMVPVVRLNFNILKNCVKEVKQYYHVCLQEMQNKSPGTKRVPKIKTKCQNYFDACGVQPKLSKLMITELFAGEDIEKMIPEVWEDIMGSGLDLFVQIPMHLCSLGIENTLIANTKSFLKGGTLLKSGKTTYGEFVSEVQKVHSRICQSSIDWLKSQPFTSTDDLGISQWLSDSYFSFTRASLVLYGVLAEEGEVSAGQEAFLEVRVLWFCLMSHMFADESVSTDIIDDYARLFLDACVKLHGYTKSNNERSSFYARCSNFFSILNTKRVCDRYGSTRNLWEGGDGGEGFIQKYKGANCPGFFRHNDEFMMPFTEKVMNAYMLDHVNTDNPMCERLHYARTLNFAIYKLESPLTEDIVVSGVVVDDRLYICFDSSKESQVVLKRLKFDDTVGKWHYNLYYAPASIEHAEVVTFVDREEVLKKSSDSFALFGVRASSNEVESEMIRFTMICRSWKIRDDDGKLRLPTPREDVLRRPSRLEDEPSAEQEGEELMDEDEQSTILTEEGGGASSCSSNKSKKRKKRKY